jgi:molecular chaperone GrpE
MVKKKKKVHSKDTRAEKRDSHTDGKPGSEQNKAAHSDDPIKEEAAGETGITEEEPAEQQMSQKENTGQEVSEDKTNEQKEYPDDEEQETALEIKLKETENKYLRLAAEFDNYRKRTLKEKAELMRYAGEDILSGLLPVIDDFERAVESINSTQDVEALKKGIELIHGKFKEFLKQKGVKEIDAMGGEFDTDLHEAVTKIPAKSKKEKGKIVDVIEKGYLLHDKVVRYSKVVIGE